METDTSVLNEDFYETLGIDIGNRYSGSNGKTIAQLEKELKELTPKWVAVKDIEKIADTLEYKLRNYRDEIVLKIHKLKMEKKNKEEESTE